jgi:hypothetical protein
MSLGSHHLPAIPKSSHLFGWNEKQNRTLLTFQS